MTRMTGPDCVVMCNLINTHTHTHTGPHDQKYNTLWAGLDRFNFLLEPHGSHSIYVHGRHSAVCVCVFFPFILDVKFVECTSRGQTGGKSHRISHPLSFYGACVYFSREKNSAVPFLRQP